MQKISDVEVFKAQAVLTGIVDMLDMCGGNPKELEEIGIDTLKAAVIDSYVSIRDYDGSNSKIIEGKIMFLGMIETFANILYPDLAKDLEKRA